MSLIERLNLKKVEFPEPFQQETVEPLMEKIFTSNPYHWANPKHYLLPSSSRPLWLIEKWTEEAFEFYEGSLPFNYPELPVEEVELRANPEWMRWQLMWDWSGARRELLPLIYWNADRWLEQQGLQLRRVNLTPKILVLDAIETDSTELDLELVDGFESYLSYRKQRERKEEYPFIRVQCGEFRADQVYLKWGTDVLVFPFPEEEDEQLRCYYLKFKENRRSQKFLD